MKYGDSDRRKHTDKGDVVVSEAAGKFNLSKENHDISVDYLPGDLGLYEVIESMTVDEM